jgi:biopolymer transport protein ExbD
MNEKKRKLALVSAIIMLILLIIIMAQIPAPAQSNMRNYRAVQKSMEYPVWKAKQKQVRIYRAKSAVKYSKETRKRNNQSARLNEKINRINSRSK